MPVTIGLMFLAGWAAGLAPATALLFGAVIAPTDPVLAADVHVGEPTLDDARRRKRGRSPIRTDQRSRSERRARLPVRVRGDRACRRREFHRLGPSMGHGRIFSSVRPSARGGVGCRQGPFAYRLRPAGPSGRTRIGHAGFRGRRGDPRDVRNHRDRARLRLPRRLRRRGDAPAEPTRRTPITR